MDRRDHCLGGSILDPPHICRALLPARLALRGLLRCPGFIGTASLIALALLASGCHHKIVSGNVLDRQAIVQIGKRVADARKLSFLRKVRFRLMGTADLARTASTEAGQMRLSGRAERQGKLLALLGLIPWGADPAQATMSMVSSQPAGLYVPQTDRLEVVIRDFPRSEILELVSLILGRDLTFGEIVAHELTHALQEQHFGLQPPAEAASNQDAELAHVALAEGDATLVGFELGVGKLLTDPKGFIDFARRRAPDMGPNVPSFLQERFKFPYLEGSSFVLALKKQGGLEAINRSLRHPPRSTEEIYHPEKYFGGTDPPRLPDLSHLPAAVDGFELVLTDTLGEFGIRTLIAQAGGSKLAQRRAAGWGGDRAAVFERRQGGGLMLVWISDWDTAADASDFFDGLEHVLAQRQGEPQAASGLESHWTAGERFCHLELWDQRVVLVDAPAGYDPYSVILAAWQSGSRIPGAAPLSEPPAAPPLDPEQAFEVDPRPPAFHQSGPMVRIGTESTGLTLGALLQVRGQKGSDNGLSIQRLRARAEGKATEFLDLTMVLELDLSGNEPLLLDAAMGFAPVSPNLLYLGHLKLGRFRVPYSQSVLTEPETLPLNAPPLLVSTLAPERRVGLGYDLDLGRYGLPLRIRAAVFDGFPEGEGFGPLTVARLDVRPSEWFAAPVVLELGAAYLHDDRHQDPDTLETRTWQGVSLHGRLSYYPLFVEGELAFLDRLPDSGLESWGWSATSGTFLLPDFLELVGRYEELNRPDAARVQQATLGLNLYYLSNRFKLVYNFIWHRENLKTTPDQFRHLIAFQLLI